MFCLSVQCYLKFRSYLKANYPKSLPLAHKGTFAFEIHWKKDLSTPKTTAKQSSTLVIDGKSLSVELPRNYKCVVTSNYCMTSWPTPPVCSRADKGWAVKRARPSKKVWCSGLRLCLEMSLVFDFGRGLRYDVVCTLDTAAVTELWRLELFSCTSSSFLCAGTLCPRGKIINVAIFLREV